MRSIRWSLVVYFLVLVALALGAVSWLVYRTTAQTLRDKQGSTAQLVEAQYQNQCNKERATVDDRILRQVQGLARKATSSSIFYEVLYPLGALSAPLHPQGYLNIPIWAAEGTHRDLAVPLHRLRPPDVTIEEAEDFLPSHKPGEPVDFFQTFHSRGQPIQRSESLGNRYLVLDPDQQTYQVRFADVLLSPTLKLRAVTWKVPWPRFKHSSSFPWPAEMFRPTKGSIFGLRPPGPPPRPPVFDRPDRAPAIFIQYATEAGPLEKRLDDFRADRDVRLAQMEQETRETLHGLRLRLLWIGLATFAGLAVGGWTLVWLGLKPLARLSEAVSRVSPQDFHLDVDVNQLPRELEPIAGRLVETLEQLQEAFAREKQAAADISHELRTPVAALLAIVDVGLRKQRTAAEYREMLEDCQATGQHMAVLVERLMSLARLDAGADQLRLKPIDVAELAFQCAELVRPLAEAKGLRLDVHARDAVPMLADADKLLEILNNLLHNAIEYNKPQGSIELSVLARPDEVVLEVTDSGIGMAPQVKEQIFQRFFRADPSRHADGPHVGLGLAIVKSFVELMAGTIEVESSPAGSTFRIRLPKSACVLPHQPATVVANDAATAYVVG